VNDAAAATNPSAAEAARVLFSRAVEVNQTGNLDETEKLCRAALAQVPDHVGANLTLGTTFFLKGDYDAAERHMRAALVVRPGMVEALNNLSLVLQLQGKVDEAVACLEKALQLRPNFPTAHSNLVYSLDHHPRTDDAVGYRVRKAWNDRYAKAMGVAHLPHDNGRDPDRKLRIGYVSGDYRNHSAAFLFLPILFGHDRRRFDVVCYSGVRVPDAMTEKCKTAATLWRDVARLGDDQLAAVIREDRVDILVDLSGHSEANRLPVFARRPAPVQITAWGYGNGTGLDAMDYIVADRIALPPEAEPFFAEKPLRLPVLAVFGFPENADPVTPLPALAKGHFTFGNLNRTSKITETTIALWARVLAAVPTAKFLIKDRGLDSVPAKARIVERFAAAGVGEERLILLGGSPRLAHMRAFGEFDLALDPVPAGGGMTLAEGLWMGVPSVLLLGRQLSGRGPSSIMTVVGLNEFVATSEDDYVAKAVAWTTRLEELAAIRAGLRDKIRDGPLGNHKLYVQMVEAGYREVWRRWCAGLPPVAIEVRP